MTIALTPELILLCANIIGLAVGVSLLLIKIGRWVEAINSRMDVLEKGQQQILEALGNHIHGSEGGAPMFHAPLPPAPPQSRVASPMQTTASGQSEGAG